MFERGDGDASGETFASARKVAKGAYVLAEAPNRTPDVILIATGSELQLAVAAREQLALQGIHARRVSAPFLEWFEQQSPVYRESVHAASVTARVSIEAGIALGWRGYVGDRGRSISIEHSGAAADGQTQPRQHPLLPSPSPVLRRRQPPSSIAPGDRHDDNRRVDHLEKVGGCHHYHRVMATLLATARRIGGQPLDVARGEGRSDRVMWRRHRRC